MASGHGDPLLFKVRISPGKGSVGVGVGVSQDQAAEGLQRGLPRRSQHPSASRRAAACLRERQEEKQAKRTLVSSETSKQGKRGE